MKKKIFASIISLVVLAFAGVGTTFAMLSNQTSKNIAITAGQVNLTSQIEEASLYTPKEIDFENMVITDPTNIASGNTFGNGGTASISGGNITLTNIALGDSITFKITFNNQSNIAIKYRVYYEDVTSYSGTPSHKLFDELAFTADGNATHVGVVKPWTKVNASTSIPSIEVKIELPISAYTTGIENSQIKFTVEAVQGNAKTKDIQALAYRTDSSGYGARGEIRINDETDVIESYDTNFNYVKVYGGDVLTIYPRLLRRVQVYTYLTDPDIIEETLVNEEKDTEFTVTVPNDINIVIRFYPQAS